MDEPTTTQRAGILRTLADELSDGALVSDADVMEGYRYDRAHTVRPGQPLAVVRAADVADVQATMRVATRFRIPVVPRGAGTGLSGGAAAVSGGITLSTERLRMLSIDAPALTATVGSGVLNSEVKDAARSHALWYPPDPSSFESCSIGGNVATNAGGLCCVKYGVTSDYVMAVQVVLADGDVVRLGRATRKDVAGYDLKRLFIGSEGTLGVVTEATLRLRPVPTPPATVVGTFPDVVTAGGAVASVMARHSPSVLELMDRAAVAAVESVRPMGLDSVGALLLAQTDSGIDVANRIADHFTDAGATFVAVTDDVDEGELLMGARRLAIPCVEQLGTVLIEDVCVPLPRLPHLAAAVEAIAHEYRIHVPIVGHAGDGNLHPLVTFDASDPDQAVRARLAFDAIMRAAVECGGTVTGEHGVGSLKAHVLADQLGASAMRLNSQIKSALDPLGILNPGKWV